MPKVFITKQEQLNNKLVTMIYGTMKVKRITQQKIANEMGITQQAFSRKLKICQFSFAELITIFNALELSDDQILSVMR